MTDERLLFLYSSNIRPLYEQDILDLLAAPRGSVYQFRYESRWVEPRTRQAWLTIAPGSPVLAHFSLQQRAHYHDPVFFPIRRGVVKQMFAEGETLFVEFVVGDFACLSEPDADAEERGFAKRAREYAIYLRDKDVPRPYEFSAGCGVDVLADPAAPIESSTNQVEIFERLTNFLQRTESFRQARFFRFLRLGPRGRTDEVVADSSGIFPLVGGQTYSLELFHHQPIDVPREEPFTVSVDGQIIRVIGRSGFDIGSRYDRIAIDLLAVQSDRYEPRETVLVIEPDKGVQGAQMRLRLRVDPPSKKLLAGSAGSAVALAGLGSASLLPLAIWGKTLVIFGCALAIVVLSFFGLFVNSLGGFSLASLRGSSGSHGSN